MASPSPEARLVVRDAGPLIHLDELACLALLADFDEVWVPSAVWDEVQQHRPNALQVAAIHLQRTSATIPLTPEIAALASLLSLHRGELEALQVARECQADLLLTDDTAGRLAARHLGIPAHGTIGVLIRAIRRKLKSQDEIVAVLKSIPTHSSLHIKRSLLAEIVREVEAQK